VTHLHWNDANHQLTHEGPAAWSGPDNTVLKVLGAAAKDINQGCPAAFRNGLPCRWLVSFD
jgi:hypothetical protein